MTMSQNPPFTSKDVDVAMRATMFKKHRSDADSLCMCGEEWPCQYLIQSSISLKLSALIAVLTGDLQTISQLGAFYATNPQKGQGFGRQ